MTSQLLWALILVQIVMGAFDTLYHHELTERLPWRVTQEHELALHAVRNVLYAAVFVLIGWFETHGAWARALIAILLVDVIITLWDCVEEDLSRALPASERVNHMLLALNYGAVLCLLVPLLLQWSRDRTELKRAFYGLWSILMALSAAAVVVFGFRDYFAARRSRRLATAGAGAELVGVLRERRNVLITGATGFVGSRLTGALAAAGIKSRSLPAAEQKRRSSRRRSASSHRSIKFRTAHRSIPSSISPASRLPRGRGLPRSAAESCARACRSRVRWCV